jgi:hypothetical protein
MADAGNAVAQVTRRTMDETISHTQRLWATVTPPIPAAPVVPAKSADSLREAGQGVVAGLEPVTNSARRALGMLFREVPPLNLPDEPDS